MSSNVLLSTPASRGPASGRQRGSLSKIEVLGRTISVPLRFLSPMTASIFDEKAARYWQRLPLHRMSGVMLAFFFTFSGYSSFADRRSLHSYSRHLGWPSCYPVQAAAVVRTQQTYSTPSTMKHRKPEAPFSSSRVPLVLFYFRKKCWTCPPILAGPGYL